MKKSIDRVYDAAVSKNEEMVVSAWEKGNDIGIDDIGTPFDQFTNKTEKTGFDELVAARILIPENEMYCSFGVRGFRLTYEMTYIFDATGCKNSDDYSAGEVFCKAGTLLLSGCNFRMGVDGRWVIDVAMDSHPTKFGPVTFANLDSGSTWQEQIYREINFKKFIASLKSDKVSMVNVEIGVMK